MSPKAHVENWEPTNPEFDPDEPMQVGGQALIEGVMMRAKGRIATAVRRADGTIVVQSQEFRSIVERHPRLKIPILRGAIGLIEMLYIGIKTLNYSANMAIDDSGKDDGMPAKSTTQASLILVLIAAIVLALGIFFFFPLLATTWLLEIEQYPLRFNLVAGMIRILTLLAYLYAISMMKDIRRLFEYHGAEHKAVFAFEQNAPLTVLSALGFTRFHPRCGTSFVLLVMFVSIFLFSFLDMALLLVVDSLTLPIRIATHIPFVPVVGGVSYEVLRFSAKRASSPLGRILVSPGLWLQQITTKEPDESQMEVSIVALRAALRREGAPVAAAPASAAVG